ncbi:MAG: GAF and ANTAR domain-containing protein [Nocardioides sp.]
MTHDQQLYLRTLSEFTRTLVTPYDVDTVFGELTTRVNELLDLSGSGVALARKGRLELGSAAPGALAALEVVQTETQSGPCATAFREGRIAVVEDLRACVERWPEYCAAAERAGIRAVAGIPLHLEQWELGALHLYSTSVRAWTEVDLAAATVMANMATAYLTNASVFDKQKRLAEQLQHALDSRIVIEQAKGVLANEHGISVDEAFAHLRKHARAHGATVQAVADAVVNVGLRPA